MEKLQNNFIAQQTILRKRIDETENIPWVSYVASK